MTDPTDKARHRRASAEWRERNVTATGPIEEPPEKQELVADITTQHGSRLAWIAEESDFPGVSNPAGIESILGLRKETGSDHLTPHIVRFDTQQGDTETVVTKAARVYQTDSDGEAKVAIRTLEELRYILPISDVEQVTLVTGPEDQLGERGYPIPEGLVGTDLLYHDNGV